MRNLAGKDDADEAIYNELALAGVDMVRVPRAHPEVPYTIEGRLGPFAFRRAWYYWVVSGLMPVEVASQIYSNPVGRRYVRAAGHGCCVDPVEWAQPQIIGEYTLDWSEGAESAKAQFEALPRTTERYIDVYHIDSQEG